MAKLRGVALVDAVMADRKKNQGAKHKGPQPLDPAALAATTLGDRPLTPALRRWLEQDGEMFVLGEPQSLQSLVATEFPEWEDAFAALYPVLTAPCVLFEGWGADSRRFLYLGEADAHGEYPVFTIDTDDTPFVCINGPVDVWLAQHAGFLEDEDVYGAVPAAYEEDRADAAARNFGGHLAFLDDQLWDTLNPY